MSRLIAVGDIHGQYEELVALMDRVKPGCSDQLVFLGDYIDRGPDAVRVVDWLLRFQQCYPQTVFLRGNHEQMLLDAVAAVQRNVEGKNNLLDNFLSFKTGGLPSAVFYFLACGGRETLTSYVAGLAELDFAAALRMIPQAHLLFFNQLPFYYEHHHFFFVHAGVDPKQLDSGEDARQAYLWERRPLWKKFKGWSRVVVHGHTPVREPYFDDLEINVDTGAGYGSCLTACNVLDGRIWQSRA